MSVSDPVSDLANCTPSPVAADPVKGAGQMSDETGMDEEIRRILAAHGRLPTDVEELPRDADLYAAGMTSHASINVMLGLEEHFDVEFPDRMLTRGVFASIASICDALTELRTDAEAVA
jgi:acyl carrier protein